jgi:hypothetical protein
MRTRIIVLFSLLGLVISYGFVPAPTRAISVLSSPLPTPLRFEQPQPLPPREAFNNGYVTVMLELSDPPALTEASADAIRERQAKNQQIQSTLQQVLQTIGAEVLFQTSLTYNGIAVSLPPAQLPAVRQLSGVKQVHLLTPKERATNVDQAQLAATTAEATWRSVGNATGRGVRLAIIDSGIDYTHATFGGPGTPAAYQNPVRTFPTAKVTGGADLAGDGYDASGKTGSTIPVPDADPLDCSGQGTHIAGTTAGFGVDLNGRTYTGPYTDGMNLSTFRVPPGLAPEGQLYALKVFGCRGTTSLITLAVEQAVAAQIDVIVLAIGSPFGGPNDPDAVAVENAMRAGITVVTAAGDLGTTYYSINTPGSARSAITVGASNGDLVAPVVLPSSSRGGLRSGGAVKPDLVAPGLNVVSAAVGTGSESQVRSGTATATAHVAGAVARMQQVNPTLTPQQIKTVLINTAQATRATQYTSFGAVTNATVPAPPSLAGAGQIDLLRINQGALLAYDAVISNTVGLSFGAQTLAAPWSATRAITLENRSSFAQRVTLSSSATVSETGVAVRLPNSPILVPAQSSVQVPVTLNVEPRELDNSPDQATEVRQSGLLRYALAEHGGLISISSQNLRTRVRPTHAAATNAVQFFINGQPLGGQLAPRTVGLYQSIENGAATVRVALSDAPSTVLVNTSINLPTEGDYSLALTGDSAGFGLIVVNNTPANPPPPGKAWLQVSHLNQPGGTGAHPLDVYINSVLTPTLRALQAGTTSNFIDIPAGLGGVAFIRAGEHPTRHSLVSWQGFVAEAGTVIMVGSGQTNNSAGYDAECQLIIQQIAAANEFAAEEFAKRANDTEFFNLVCTAGRRGVTGIASYQPPVPVAGATIRLPYYIFPQAASLVNATSSVLSVLPDATNFELPIQNTGARSLALPNARPAARTALTAAFELTASSGQIPNLNPALRPADLQYVGITSNIGPAVSLENSLIFFGMSTYASWATPQEVEFRIYIDTNRNGLPDRLILNTSLGALRGQANDTFISPVYVLNETTGVGTAIDFAEWNSLPPQNAGNSLGLDVAPFNTSVLFLTASAATLGLTSTQPSFTYYVETISLDRSRFGQVIDRIPATGQPSLVYNPLQTPIRPINPTGGLALRPLFIATNAAVIQGQVNSAQLNAQGSAQLLLLHLHNPSNQQAELVRINTATEPAGSRTQARNLLQRLYLPIVR